MILETIVTSQSADKCTHIAPMGIQVTGEQFIIMPFKPSTTLDNILNSRCAVINFTDDVRIFAGSVTGRRDWPLSTTDIILGEYLSCALTHVEVKLEQVKDEHQIRPKLICSVQHQVTHAPFYGFNRAQYSVLEAAILISRLDRLPWTKIEQELDYLRIGVEKTAGIREQEAWGWLMQRVNEFRQPQVNKQNNQ